MNDFEKFGDKSDSVTKQDFRGRRNKNNKTIKKNHKHQFDDENLHYKTASKKGHSRRHIIDEIDIDEEHPYGDFMDYKKILK